MDFDSLLMIEILKAGFTWYGVGESAYYKVKITLLVLSTK